MHRYIYYKYILQFITKLITTSNTRRAQQTTLLAKENVYVLIQLQNSN